MVVKNKIQLLKELNLSKNICFNQISKTAKQIHITKSKTNVSSMIKIREICNIQTILNKYKQSFNITISIDEVKIQNKEK